MYGTVFKYIPSTTVDTLSLASIFFIFYIFYSRATFSAAASIIVHIVVVIIMIAIVIGELRMRHFEKQSSQIICILHLTVQPCSQY